MSSVDNRIVNMTFNNATFERGVSTTISSLDNLEKSLQFKDAQAGLSGVQASIDKFHLGPIEGAVTRVSNSFLAMSTIAITALSNITNKAINAGSQIVKSLTIDPIGAGFNEFELKMGAIQTIMAGSGENLKTVNKYLNELNAYSDQTIYSFADMTQNIGKFTNAGISLKDSVASIKGVANVAALSGANAEEASRAMYNFAQALSSGAVRLADWKSIELANMGTKEFKQQLIDAALAAGTLRKTAGGMYETITGKKRLALSATKGFNDSLSEEWLTTEVLNKTLGKYADANTKIGKRATAAASEIKTFSQMLDTLKESAGSGWAETWEILIGNFKEGKKLWTGLGNFFGGFIKNSADARNKLLKDWKKLGGREDLIAGIKNVFGALGDVIRPIGEAFRQIFPATTGKRLAEITKGFAAFAERLRLSEDTINNIKRTFAGLFSVFSIVKQIISGALGAIGKALSALFTAGEGAGGGFLALTAKAGDFLTKLDSMLKKSKVIEKFFGVLGDSAAKAVKFIQDLIGAIGSLFTGGDSKFLDDLVSRFDELGPIIDAIKTKLQGFSDFIKGFFGSLDLGSLFSFGDGDSGEVTKAVGQITVVRTSIEKTQSALDRIKETANKIWSAIKTVFGKIRDGIAAILEGISFEDALAIINTGFFILLYNTLRNFIKTLGGLMESYGKVFESASGVLDQVTSNLKTMQADVKADIILKIAGALALLALAIFVLSKVDTKGLAQSLVAITILLGLLVGAVKRLEQVTSTKGSVNMTLLSAGLIGLAIAISIMAGAVAILGSMDTATLVKGITAVALILASLIAAAKLMEKTGASGQLIAAAIAIGIMAASLTALAGAIALYATLNTGLLIEGGLKIAATLGLIAVMMRLMPKKKMLSMSVGLLIIAAALNAIVPALLMMGSMSPEQIAKALIMLGGSMLILALALKAMDSSIAGAGAIALVALALNMLIPPIVVLANLSWAQLGMALLGLAAIFIVLAAAAALFTVPPLIATLFLLAQAILMLGAGAALAGAGIFLFATGLALLTTVGAAGIAVLVSAIITLIELFPLIMQQIGLGIVAFAAVIGEKMPQLMEAVGKMLDALLDLIIEYAPKLYDTVYILFDEFLGVLNDRMPEILDKGGDLVVTFIEGIGAQDLKIIKAAGDTLLKFLEGLTDWLNDNEGKFEEVGHDLAKAITKGIISGIRGSASGVWDAVKDLANGMPNVFKGALLINSPSRVFEELGRGIPEGTALGVDNGAGMVDQSIEDMGNSAVTTMQKTMQKMADIMDADMNTEPVIAPVLDLTAFRKDVTEIQSMLTTKPVSTNFAYNQAASIASTSTEISQGSNTAQDGTPQIVFEQNNYSPTALSPIEIYRNTKNQISLAKEVLAG